MKIQPYKQSTVESCLASCLLQLRHLHKGESISQKHEREMLFHALEFSRKDFVAGHLDYFERQFGIKTKRYVHNKILYDLVNDECKTEMEIKGINVKLIDEMIEKQPIIIIIDAGILYKALYNTVPYHYPHWIIVYGKENDNYLIYEPWEGKATALPEKILKCALNSYLNRLWGAPQLITLKATNK